MMMKKAPTTVLIRNVKPQMAKLFEELLNDDKLDLKAATNVVEYVFDRYEKQREMIKHHSDLMAEKNGLIQGLGDKIRDFRVAVGGIQQQRENIYRAEKEEERLTTFLKKMLDND